MNKIFFITQQYITKILLIPLLTYAFLCNSCPTCQYRIEKNSPAFFIETNEPSLALSQTEAVIDNEIELEATEETHA